MIIREARNDDKEYIMSWIKDIWEGHDYIPYVWDEWLKDPRGTLYVVEEEDKPIALWHIRWLGKDTAWLEGMRVKQDYRNRGIATMTAVYSINIAREKGLKYVMLSTLSTNKPAVSVMKKLRFNKIGGFYDFNIKNIGDTITNYKDRCIEWEELGDRYPRLKQNNYLVGYYERPWIFKDITKSEYIKNCKDGKIIFSMKKHAVAMLGVSYEYKDKKNLYVRYLDGYDEQDLRDIITLLRKKAVEEGCERIYGYIPPDTNLAIMLEKYGIKVDKSREILVYRYIL
jgi:GNAT superfamily N-acetyltransferase